MKRPTKEQWEQLRNLDRMASKAPPKSLREKYVRKQIEILRDKMGLSRLSVSGPNANAAPDKHSPDGLPADADLSGDLGTVHTLFDI